MGVTNLLGFTLKKCPEAFRDLPYSHFRGKRVAVDSNNVLTKLMARSHKEIVNETDVCVKDPDRTDIIEKWYYHLREEIIKFMKAGITLLFVFDGAYIPEKSTEQKKRREEKAKRVREAEELKQKILLLDELERTPQMVTELRKKMHHLGNVTKDDWSNVKELLKSLGFPVLHATGEGEKLCAMLCIEGLISAVYSRDSDLLAMGCPISFSGDAGWVYNPESKRTELALKCTLFKPVLSALEMEYSTFLDLCIMAGNDFNDNIYRIGIATAYKSLKNCKTIENLPEKYQNKIEILNHVRSREIFARENSKDICVEEIVLNLQGINCDLPEWQDVKDYYVDFPTPSNVFVEKVPSLKTSSIKLKIVGVINTDNNKPVIPKQKASPIKLNNKMVESLASQQLQSKQLISYKLKILS